MFNLSGYLRGLAKMLLIMGLLITLVLAFTIVFVDDPDFGYSIEFSLSGLFITFSVLFGSIIIHAVFLWLASMLKATEAMSKALAPQKKKENAIIHDESEEDDPDEY